MSLTSFFSIASSFRLVESELLINNENSSAEGRREWSDATTLSTADSTLPPAPPQDLMVPPAPLFDRTAPPPMPVLDEGLILDEGSMVANVLLTLAENPELAPERALVPAPERALVPASERALVPAPERALVLDSNENLVSFPEGEIAGENSESDSDDEVDPDADLVGEDDEDHTLPDYVYEDATLQELMSDRYGVRRSEVDQEKLELLGSTTVAHGNTWTVRTDVLPEDVGIDPDADDIEDFVELGVRSKFLSEENVGFPQHARTNNDVRIGRRTSPRNKKKKERMNEAKVMFELFITLYPVGWRSSLGRLNDAISQKNARERLQSRHIRKITQGEY